MTMQRPEIRVKGKIKVHNGPNDRAFNKNAPHMDVQCTLYTTKRKHNNNNNHNNDNVVSSN